MPADRRDLLDAVSCVRRGHLYVLSFRGGSAVAWWEAASRLRLLVAVAAFRLSIRFAAAKAGIGYAGRSSMSFSCRAFLREDVFRTTKYLDALYDRGHVASLVTILCGSELAVGRLRAPCLAGRCR